MQPRCEEKQTGKASISRWVCWAKRNVLNRTANQIDRRVISRQLYREGIPYAPCCQQISSVGTRQLNSIPFNRTVGHFGK
jgi:hypothetical protein